MPRPMPTRTKAGDVPSQASEEPDDETGDDGRDEEPADRDEVAAAERRTILRLVIVHHRDSWTMSPGPTGSRPLDSVEVTRGATVR